MIVVTLLAMQASTLSLATPNGRPPTQAKLNAMSDQCHTAHDWLRHGGGRAVTIHVPASATFEQTDCLLRQLKGSDLNFDLGFIGNEVAPSKARAR